MHEQFFGVRPDSCHHSESAVRRTRAFGTAARRRLRSASLMDRCDFSRRLGDASLWRSRAVVPLGEKSLRLRVVSVQQSAARSAVSIKNPTPLRGPVDRHFTHLRSPPLGRHVALPQHRRPVSRSGFNIIVRTTTLLLLHWRYSHRQSGLQENFANCNEFHKLLDLQSGVSGIIVRSRDVELPGIRTPFIGTVG